MSRPTPANPLPLPREPVDLARFEGHTPGPWSLPHFADSKPLPEISPALFGSRSRCECGYVFGNDDRHGAVATVHYKNDNNPSDENPPRHEAVVNGRLIAAAPDLLAEVIRLRAALAAERAVVIEECAKVCDELHKLAVLMADKATRMGDTKFAIAASERADAYEIAAKRIRALSSTPSPEHRET